MRILIVANNSGYAALVALTMVVMMTLIGLAALSTSDDEVTIAGNGLQETRAFFATEGGLEMAASRIQQAFDSTGRPPVELPEGSLSLNNCDVTFSTTDGGPAQQKILTSGTVAGLHALVKTFSLNSLGVSDVEESRIALSVAFETALVPIFQFAVFYEEDLEIAPGPKMTLAGRVHSNGDMYLQAGDSLSIDSWVTSAGDIYHGRKGPGGASIGEVRIKDAGGSYISMQDGGDWLDSDDSYWYDSSSARWGGKVQDAAYGQGGLNVPLEGATNDPHKLIENASGNPDSYERRATIKFIDGTAYEKVGGVWNDVTADMTTRGIISFADDQFTDQREGETVDVMELDVEKMYDEGYGPDNGVIYFSDEAIAGNWPAMRINNANELDAPLLIASENPIYTNGNFNNVNKQPAAIMADAVTFLSNSWDDTLSSGSASIRVAVETSVNASIITGNVETTSSDYSGGFENLPRFLETWTGVNFNWSGSMVNLWESAQATGTWNGSYYVPPNRNWSYDTDLNDPSKMPPETPSVRVFQRTGWQQLHVSYEAE